MTTAGTARTEPWPEAGRIGDVPLWGILAVGGVIAAAIYAFAPLSVNTKDLVVYNLAELGAVVGIVSGVRRLGALARRPQTGQLHQYYLQALAVLALVLVVLVLVR